MGFNGEFKVPFSDEVIDRFNVDSYVDSDYGKIHYAGVKISGVISSDWFCGYVEIPEGHPWLELVDRTGNLDYDLVTAAASTSPLYEDLEGGAVELTFAEDRWVGFDTAHLIDQRMNWNEEKLLKNILIWTNIVANAGFRN